jgi:hypothetical protein
MLAYLDHVLDPADAEELGRKIQESDFATGLVERIKLVLRKLRMDAPRLDGKGMGNDANTVAEYLDSTLPQDRVGDFERVCLESDKHLCEVAACHQILALVLGKPADVPPHLRERIYALSHPERLPVRAEPPVIVPVAPAEAKAPAPPAPSNGQPEAAPLEVPDYLKTGRPASAWPVLAGVIVLLLVIGGLRLLGPFNRQHPLVRLVQRGDAVAQRSADSEADKSAAKAKVEPTPKKAAEGAQPSATATPPQAASTTASGPPANNGEKTAATDPPAASPQELPARPVPADDAPAVVAKSAATPSEAPPTAIAASPAPATDAGMPPPAAASSAAPSNTSSSAAASPGGSPPPADATAAAPMPKLPVPPMPAAPAVEARPVIEVGRYTSDGQPGQILATLSRDDGLWRRKPPLSLIAAEERLLVLPPYRPQIALPSGVQVTFAGEGEFVVPPPGETGVSRLAVNYGRFLIVTVGAGKAQLEVDLAGIVGTITLVDADSSLAVKAGKWLVPGLNPEELPGMPVVELYNVAGRVTWQQAGKEKVEIPPHHVHVYIGDESPETVGPFLPPEWIDPRNVAPIDRSASQLLENQLSDAKPLNLSLQESMQDRRVEVRALAARCLATLGEFEPILKELSDSRQNAFWPAEIETVKQALRRGTETAAEVRAALERLRGADAAELYRLLWGYNPDQLERGGAAQLVKSLESEQMDFRVLAFHNLVMITGAMEFYRPERSPTQLRQAIQNWKERRDKGSIVYKLPPTPLEVYRPMPASPAGPAAETRRGNPAP